MDLEEILYYLRRSGLNKKLMFIGCLVVLLIGLMMLAFTVFLVSKYHTQLYDGITGIIKFIFGNSPEDEIRGVFKKITDNYLSNLFKEE